MANDPLSRFLLFRFSLLEKRMAMRPMGSVEIIDFSLRIYQALGRPILRQTAVASVFTFSGLAFLFWILLPMLSVTRDPSSVGTQVGEAVVVLILALAVAIPISLIGFSYTSGVVVKLVSDHLSGAVPDLGSASRTGAITLRKLFILNVFEAFVACSGILGSTLLLLLSAWLDSRNGSDATSGMVAVLAVFGFMFGGLVFLAVLSRHILAPAITVLEERKAIDAARRSVAMMRGTRSHPNGYGTVFALYTILGVIAAILTPSIGILMGIVDLQSGAHWLSSVPILGQNVLVIFQMLPLYLFIWVSVPIWCVATTVLYFERRVRLEGYDIELLARDMARSRKESRFEL